MNFIDKGDTTNELRLIKVIIGDCDENIGQMFCKSLSEDSKGRLVIETTVAMRSDELIESVQINDFDIALLILNNIIYNSHDEDVRERINWGMALISELSDEFDLPVIALYGVPHDGELAEQMLEHGAVFASQLPCDWNKLVSAFFNYIKSVNHKITIAN